MSATAVHTPVMLDEVLACLRPPRPEALMVDCNLGEGGHAEAFLSAHPALRYLGIDADPRIQAKARERLASFAPRVEFMEGFSDELLGAWATELAEGRRSDRPELVLFDLGISMHHYAESGRGFGFGRDEALDMRLSPSLPRSAEDIVNGEREEELARLIAEYGEERYARRIARAIVEARRSSRIATSGRLAELVSAAVPAEYRNGRIHPATRSFQAIRIAVNDELGRADRAIRAAAAILAPGGAMAVITFHSLEDRIAKNALRELSREPEAFVPGFGLPAPETGAAAAGEPLKLLWKKPREPGAVEVARNPAARSAKLRAAVKPSGAPAPRAGERP